MEEDRISSAQAFGGCALEENNPYQAGRELVADYLCSSKEAFVQFLATNLLPNEYWFYVKGEIPEGKDVRAIDRKLLDLYGLNLSKWARARRRKKGEAKVRYIRVERFFVLIATYGRHPFFELEGKQIKDIRISPLKFNGYSISFKKGHSSVRMQQPIYRTYKAKVLALAKKIRSPGYWYSFFWNLPFSSYAGINQEKFSLLRLCNRIRKSSGLPTLDWERAIKLKRPPAKVFVEPETETTQVVEG